MSRFVQFSEFGGPEVLRVADVENPQPGSGMVRVRVKAAGLNPVDHKIFAGGPAATAYGVALPSGNGNDFSGTVDAVGEDVSEWAVGDEVLGGFRFHAQADFVVVDAARVIRKPELLTFEQAGALDIAGRTAWASVASQRLDECDTVLVSAAAGGVGVIAAQLAVQAGATVVGTASEENHDFLRSLGVIPVAYGDGLEDRVRAVVTRLTAVLDNNGRATIDAGLALGVEPDRINTIAARGYASGVRGVGGQDADIHDLARVAKLVAAGTIVLPVDSVFPLERITEAYQRMIAGHLRGKIVVVTD